MEFLIRLQRQLERDEGTRTLPYRDTQGHLTIGIGHNLDEPLHESLITAIFEYDCHKHMVELFDRLPWAESLNEARRGALINLAFNMGVPGLIRGNPKMLAALEQKNYPLAAFELLDGPYKDQVGPRAFRLAKQIEIGTWQ